MSPRPEPLPTYTFHRFRDIEQVVAPEAYGLATAIDFALAYWCCLRWTSRKLVGHPAFRMMCETAVCFAVVAAFVIGLLVLAGGAM